MSPDALRSMLSSGEIRDSYTIQGLALWSTGRERN